MNDLLAWWFLPKRRVSSIIKFIIGIVICGWFFGTLLGNTRELINTIVRPPLYIGLSFVLLPIILKLFMDAIFVGALFCLPFYHIFGKRSGVAKRHKLTPSEQKEWNEIESSSGGEKTEALETFVEKVMGEGGKRYWIPILIVALMIGSMVATTVYPEHGIVEIIQKQLSFLEDKKLGTKNSLADYYTLREYGYDIAELTKNLDFLFNEDEGFSKLALFYKDSEKSWEEYENMLVPDDMDSAFDYISKKIYLSNGYGDEYETIKSVWFLYNETPSQVKTARTNYLVNHPEVDAYLVFWGKSSGIVPGMSSTNYQYVANLINTWYRSYGITDKMVQKTN